MANKLDYVTRVRTEAQTFITTADHVQALAIEGQRMGYIKNPDSLADGCIEGNADVSPAQVIGALLAAVQFLQTLTDDQKNAIYQVKP